VDILANFGQSFLAQLQSPTLAFLFGGMLLAALGSKLTIPDAIYRFIVFMLLMRIGLHGGMEIREADLRELAFPAFLAASIGCLTVLIGWLTLAKLPKVKFADAIATAGLFGAVSASTLAAALIILEEQNITYEAWAPALYPFMDIPALVLAIVLAAANKQKNDPSAAQRVEVWKIIKDSQGFLSILLLIMGMEAYSRLAELRHVAQWSIIYALFAPIIHGLLGFGLGYVAHILFGFSPGGVIVLAIIASSNSDISGPPTLRAGIPDANPSSYIGSSTSVGTPIALAVCIPLFIALADIVFPV